MRAAVYRGPDEIQVEEIPVPRLEKGEVLVEVSACGVSGSDAKEIEDGRIEAPCVPGREIAGIVAQVAPGVRGWSEGDRVALYSQVPDRDSWYSLRGHYAQCPQYQSVATTAGFEPAGGGFAQFVRVLPWAVRAGGLWRVPDGVSLEEAAFVAPVNACLKATRLLDLDEGDVVLVAGLGSIGLTLLQLARREGAEVIGADPLPGRRRHALALGARTTLDPTREDLTEACRAMTAGRGADAAIVAAAGDGPVRDALRATRPGAAILLFAPMRRGDEVAVDVGDICLGEKRVIGSTGTSVEVAEEAAEVVFDREIDVLDLVSHRFPLEQATEAIRTTSQPADDVCKVLVLPGGALV
jgi:L-iditol 2-dehydrogenase